MPDRMSDERDVMDKVEMRGIARAALKRLGARKGEG
jgi:hypothetical protein